MFCVRVILDLGMYGVGAKKILFLKFSMKLYYCQKIQFFLLGLINKGKLTLSFYAH